LREELQYEAGYERRQRAFHHNDDMHISVRELWEAWLRSEVRRRDHFMSIFMLLDNNTYFFLIFCCIACPRVCACVCVYVQKI